MDNQNLNAVSQKIFQMDLPVETVSVYLLCCGLAESGANLSRNTLQGVWNGTDSQLSGGLKTLEDRGVLRRIISGSEDNAVYKLADPEKWKCH